MQNCLVAKWTAELEVPGSGPTGVTKQDKYRCITRCVVTVHSWKGWVAARSGLHTCNTEIHHQF